ncbi:MAG: glycosyltransferase family 4 protein [Candidatus Methanomethylicia archaeon]
MRVLILYAGYISRISGTSERVFQISRGLANHGVQVILSGAVRSYSKQLNRNLHLIAMPNRVSKLLDIVNWIIKLIIHGFINRYDVAQIESFSPFRTLLLLILLHPFSRRVITVFHDRVFKHNPKGSVLGLIRLALVRILLALSDASITPGLSVKRFFEELYGESACKKIVVIPNGVPSLNVKNDIYIRRKYGFNLDVFIVLFFGSMDFKPNYDAALFLYEKSSFISTKFKEITGRKLVFIVAGIGSSFLPKSEHFIPLGFISDLNELLSLPNVIVLPHVPSHSGPHVKTIYAFFSRKPVIATDDAVKDLPYVTPGKHFLLFNINKPETLLEALINLYSNKDLVKNLVSNAYIYSNKFSWSYISRIHLSLYVKLLQY